nr:ribonuclease H-like domain-containing protein [Tanacetum cinerariifolium]
MGLELMANDEEDHALVAEKEAPTEFALMANTSAESKDLSWTGLLEFKDDTVTDYSRHAPTEESSPNGAQNRNPSVTEEASPSTISPKSFIKFVKANDSPTKSKIDKAEKSPVKHAEQYRKPTQKPNGENGTSRSQNNTHKSFTPRPAVHKPYRPSMRLMRLNMNDGRPKRTSFNKPAHSYSNRPFQRTSAVRSQYRAPWVPTVNRKFPPVNRKLSTVSRNFSTVNRKFPTGNRKFPTGGTKFHIADMGKKRKLHMIGNISYLSDFEPFDGGYVSFGQGGCKIIGKGTIKTECIVLGRNFELSDDDNVLLRTPRQHNMYSIDLNNIVPHKDLTCLVAKASADELADDFSRFTWSFFLKTKDETSSILRKFITEIENLKVKIIRCDNGGGEFRNKEMNNFCSQKGIKREFSNVKTPQQNGVAKRRNKTLIEAARTMLADAKLPPQDDCSTDVSESSGNSNPTATLTNPPADQLETLTVETPIPTVSSPVPTACFTDSPKPSNILGVTTNSDESNGVKADVSNMETTITASPTSTLRIHKDHPKSQIIGPVDTPIQTRNKSK